MRTTGAEFRQRRLALGLSPDRLRRYAGISRRSLYNAENGTAGAEVVRKLDAALTALENGEEIVEQENILRLEARPGVWITMDAEDLARLGDVRQVEDDIRELIKKYGGQA